MICGPLRYILVGLQFLRTYLSQLGVHGVTLCNLIGLHHRKCIRNAETIGDFPACAK